MALSILAAYLIFCILVGIVAASDAWGFWEHFSCRYFSHRF